MASPDDPVQNGGPCPICKSPTRPYGPLGKRKCSNDRCENSQGYSPSDFAKIDKAGNYSNDYDGIDGDLLNERTNQLMAERKLGYRQACSLALSQLQEERDQANTPPAGDESGGFRTPAPAVRVKTKPQSRQTAAASLSPRAQVFVPKRGESPESFAKRVAVAKAEDAFRADPKTQRETLRSLRAERAEGEWLSHAPIAKAAFNIEDDYAALAAWMVTPEGSKAYEKYERQREGME